MFGLPILAYFMESVNVSQSSGFRYYSGVKEMIRQKILGIVRSLMEEGVFASVELPDIEVMRPKDDRLGDHSTNVAMILAKLLGKNPMEMAELVSQQLIKDSQQENLFEKIEVAKPGYINFSLSQKALADVLVEVAEKDGRFGDAEIGNGTKVNNEFVSANPTGPLHLGNARGGFFGDSVSHILRKAGYEVTNEYYVNDAGEQVAKLGHSVLGDDEAVYSGDYLEQLRKKVPAGLSASTAGVSASAVVLSDFIKPTVSEKMGIVFDSWISEKKDIVEAGLVDKAIGVLKEKGLTFESEGALWLRTTGFGDDKDRVLVKSDGTRTYFASDCGYILHKKDRGFSRLILTLGADHHGYKARLLAAAKALGFDGDFDFTFVQLVRLVKDGKEVRMSKRAGNVVTIDELLEKIPVDVARFFFLMYSPDTHMNFDLGLAEERSAKNPVYYVQYAHARLSSILRKAEEVGMSPDGADLSLLVHPKERLIMRELAFFPELVADAAESLAPHRLPPYAMRLSDRLHSFYDECRVIDPENPELSKARLALISATKTILRETLGLLGVSAPERMEQDSDREQESGDKEEKTKNE